MKPTSSFWEGKMEERLRIRNIQWYMEVGIHSKISPPLDTSMISLLIYHYSDRERFAGIPVWSVKMATVFASPIIWEYQFKIHISWGLWRIHGVTPGIRSSILLKAMAIITGRLIGAQITALMRFVLNPLLCQILFKFQILRYKVLSTSIFGFRQHGYNRRWRKSSRAYQFTDRKPTMF